MNVYGIGLNDVLVVDFGESVVIMYYMVMIGGKSIVYMVIVGYLMIIDFVML